VKPVGVALVGYGGIGRVHALAYRAIPFHYGLPADSVCLVGVATSRAETAEQAAREAGCPIWTADYRTLLGRDDVEVVDVCVPNIWREPIVTAAAQAGKHIYCEKPLARNLAEGRRIVEAVARSGVKAQLCFNFRFFPAVMRARQLMQAGFLGRIFSFRACYYRSSYISPSKPLSWRLRREAAGGGALLDLGAHVLDLVAYLLGEVEAVSALVDTLIKERPVAAGSAEYGPVDVDDLALLQLRLAGGAVGSVEVSRMGTGYVNFLAIEVFGEKGALRFNSEAANWLEVFDVRDPDQPLGGLSGMRRVQTASRYPGQKAPDASMPADFVRTHVECQYQFLKAVAEDTPPSPTFDEGLHVQAIMEAAVESSAQGRWVSLRDLQPAAPRA
jgi:predicted dehydrogenase